MAFTKLSCGIVNLLQQWKLFLVSLALSACWETYSGLAFSDVGGCSVVAVEVSLGSCSETEGFSSLLSENLGVSPGSVSSGET